MDSTQSIFSTTLQENRKNQNLNTIITDTVYELSKKRIQRLKDDTNIQARLGELFEMYIRILQNEKIKKAASIDAIISGLIKAGNHDKEEFLYKSIYERDQLEQSILDQKESMNKNIISTFNVIEKHIGNLDEEIASDSLKALSDTKLRGVEMLGILKETTHEALLTTLEKAEDIRDTSYEITKKITFEAINDGEFSKDKILEISSTVLGVVVEIADEDQSNAKSLLVGSIHGIKDGVAKSIEKFKNALKYTPEELETSIENFETIKNEIKSIDSDLVWMVRVIKDRSSGVSSSIIDSILEGDIDSSLSRIKRATTEVRETLGESIESFEKIASSKFEAIKKDERTKNATKEAKRLGNHAWATAKNVLDATIATAKEVMK